MAITTKVSASSCAFAGNLLDFGKALLTDLAKGFADILSLRTAQISGVLQPAALAIKTGGSAIVRSTTNIVAKVGGTWAYVAAGDMSAIAGTLVTAHYAGWAFYVDNAGTVTTSTKTADCDSFALALAAVSAISTPSTKVLIGFIIVQNATGSDFTAGTTALDASNVTTTYFNVSGNATSISAPTSATRVLID
jgi:hypothetical protein